MLSKEQLKCVHFLGDTLDVIQSINTNNDLDAFESLLQLSNSIDDLLLLEVL